MRSTMSSHASRSGRTRRVVLGLVLLGLLAGSLLPIAGPVPALAQEPPTRGGRVLDSLIWEPDSLDPARANLLVSQYVLGLLYDRLVYIDQTGRPRRGSPSRGRSTRTAGRSPSSSARGSRSPTGRRWTPRPCATRWTATSKISKRNADLGPVQKIEVVGGGGSVRLTFERPFAALFTALDISYLGIVSKARWRRPVRSSGGGRSAPAPTP